MGERFHPAQKQPKEDDITDGLHKGIRDSVRIVLGIQEGGPFRQSGQRGQDDTGPDNPGRHTGIQVLYPDDSFFAIVLAQGLEVCLIHGEMIC